VSRVAFGSVKLRPRTNRNGNRNNRNRVVRYSSYAPQNDHDPVTTWW